MIKTSKHKRNGSQRKGSHLIVPPQKRCDSANQGNDAGFGESPSQKRARTCRKKKRAKARGLKEREAVGKNVMMKNTLEAGEVVEHIGDFMCVVRLKNGRQYTKLYRSLLPVKVDASDARNVNAEASAASSDATNEAIGEEVVRAHAPVLQDGDAFNSRSDVFNPSQEGSNSGNVHGCPRTTEADAVVMNNADLPSIVIRCEVHAGNPVTLTGDERQIEAQGDLEETTGNTEVIAGTECGENDGISMILKSQLSAVNYHNAKERPEVSVGQNTPRRASHRVVDSESNLISPLSVQNAEFSLNNSESAGNNTSGDIAALSEVNNEHSEDETMAGDGCTSSLTEGMMEFLKHQGRELCSNFNIEGKLYDATLVEGYVYSELTEESKMRISIEMINTLAEGWDALKQGMKDCIGSTAESSKPAVEKSLSWATKLFSHNNEERVAYRCLAKMYQCGIEVTNKGSHDGHRVDELTNHLFPNVKKCIELGFKSEVEADIAHHGELIIKFNSRLSHTS